MFKENKDGQTHYQNDGCGEPAHNQKEDKWEDEIDEWFGNGAEGDLTRGRFSIKEIKDFISKIESNTIARCIGVVRKIIKEERGTWSRDSIGDKALRSLEMAIFEDKFLDTAVDEIIKLNK